MSCSRLCRMTGRTASRIRKTWRNVPCSCLYRKSGEAEEFKKRNCRSIPGIEIAQKSVIIRSVAYISDMVLLQLHVQEKW